MKELHPVVVQHRVLGRNEFRISSMHVSGFTLDINWMRMHIYNLQFQSYIFSSLTLHYSTLFFCAIIMQQTMTLYKVAWVVAAYAIATYTHLFHTIFTDGRILRPIFHISIMLFSINIVLTLYLTVYLPFKFPVSNIHKTPASSPAFWEVYCPRVIPVMTGCGVVGSFLLVRACYPVWGFLTPLILGVVTFGFFFSLHFIPWCW